MMIKSIKNKISEQRGASLAMALFALIAVTAVSAVMLNSSLSNIGRVKRNRQAEQNYLTESSAAKLIEKCLVGVKIEYEKTEGDIESPENNTEILKFTDDYEISGTGGRNNPFKTELEEWFKDNIDGAYDLGGTDEKGHSAGTVYLIKSDENADLIEDVAVRIKLDGVEDKTGNRSGFVNLPVTKGDIGSVSINLTADIFLNRSSSEDNYIMSMTLPFTCSGRVREEKKTTDPDENGDTKDYTVRKTECSFISGNSAKFARGSAKTESGS